MSTSIIILSVIIVAVITTVLVLVLTKHKNKKSEMNSGAFLGNCKTVVVVPRVMQDGSYMIERSGDLLLSIQANGENGDGLILMNGMATGDVRQLPLSLTRSYINYSYKPMKNVSSPRFTFGILPLDMKRKLAESNALFGAVGYC